MFGHAYFGARYFAPRYFGPAASVTPTPDTGGESPWRREHEKVLRRRRREEELVMDFLAQQLPVMVGRAKERRRRGLDS